MGTQLSKIGSQWIERYIATIQWFIPLHTQDNARELTRAQNVINAVVMAALSGPFYALAYYELGFTTAALEILLCCLLMFTAPFLLRATGSIVAAREVFLCAVFFNFTWLTYYLGGVDAPTVGWLITAPVVAMFLGGIATALFWLAMSCAAVLAIYAAHAAGVPPPPHPVQDMEMLHLLCDLGLYIVVVVFVLLFELTKIQGFIKLEQALKIINELAIRDELTGSHNRRHLIRLIETEKERAARVGGMFCLCLLDIDHFKRINDTYGHQAGDTVLREFAATVQRQIRESDSFGRYGGEEFLLMLPETTIDEAHALAERARANIARLGFTDLPELAVTVSIGIAEFRADETIAQTVARADEALYQAKSSGRNRVVRYGEPQDVQAATMPVQSAPALPDGGSFDNLTGLLNRRMLRDRLAHALERAVRNSKMAGLILLSVNKFKEINDMLGYEAGDTVLVQVATTLRSVLRDCDTVARWSSDEFAILIEDLAEEADAVQVAHKIIERFAAPITVQQHTSFVTFNAGVTVFPAAGADHDMLLQRADDAMMRAKSWGENTVEIYASQPAAMPNPNHRLVLKNALREALGSGELFLEYQPQVELASGAIVGVEALVRWRHPERGVVSPAEFIPLAEETGLIVPIGDWVLRTACAQQRAWVEAGLPSLKMAVNLSARQFRDPGLVGRVLAIIAETRIDPRCLDLEITESVLIEQPEAHQATMTRLRAAGVKISIDDFGTGYSSLNYLSELPVDVLKIDGAFVRRLGQTGGRPRSRVIAELIIEMAHRLDLNVIAEVVETPEQLDELRRMGCDVGQGYYFNRPLHPDRVAELLQRPVFSQQEALAA